MRVYAVPDGTLLFDLPGHTDAVYAVALSPDDGRLATAGFDTTVRLWDLTDGRALGTFTGHSDFVYDVAFTPDGRALLSASKDRSIKRLDAGTLKGVRTYSDHDEDVIALAVKPDGSGFVSAGLGSQLRLWDADPDADKPAKKAGGGPVHDLAFSRDGTRLLSVGEKVVRLVDPRTGAAGKTLPGASDVQYAAALSADGTLAAAAGFDGVVRLWDVESAQPKLSLIQPAGEGRSGLALSPDGVLTAHDALRALVRWRVGDREVDPEPLTSWLARRKP